MLRFIRGYSTSTSMSRDDIHTVSVTRNNTQVNTYSLNLTMDFAIHAPADDGQMRLLRAEAADAPPNGRRPLLVYVPGMDCTGQCVKPQLSALLRVGYSVRSCYIPPTDRSTWEQLVTQLCDLLAAELRNADVDGAYATRAPTSSSPPTARSQRTHP